MPTLQDLIAAHQAAQDEVEQSNSTDWHGPTAASKAAGQAWVAATPKPDMTSMATPYTPPDGGKDEQDRLLNEAKGTLAKVDPFAKMLEREGQAGAESFANQYGAQDNDLPLESAKYLGNYVKGVGKGAISVVNPMTYVNAAKSAAEGVADLPAFLKGLSTEDLKNVGSMAADTVTNPESLGELVGGVAAGSYLPGAIKEYAPKVAVGAPKAIGGAIEATGRGLETVGTKLTPQGGTVPTITAVTGHPYLAAAELTVPPALRGLGRVMQRGGAALKGVDVEGGLKSVADAAKAAKEYYITGVPNPDDLAAANMRTAVDTARDYEAQGMSRAQAAQRAGVPYGGDLAIDPETGAASNKYGPVDLGTHPGQDVQAHWPYEPAVRGSSGNVIRPGQNSPQPSSLKGISKVLNSADDLAGPASQQADRRQFGPAKPLDELSVPEAMQGGERFLAGARSRGQAKTPYYAGDVLSHPGAQAYLARESAANRPIAQASQEASDTAEADRLMQAYKAHQGAADAQFEAQLTGPERDLSGQVSNRLARLSRARARSKAARGNSPIEEGQ